MHKSDFAYTYDKGGNILSINDVTPQCGIGASDELKRSFEYDALYRLLSATGRENKPNVDFPRWDDTTRSDDPNNTKDYSQTYSYDLMGNINELQHQGTNNFTRTFNCKNNLLNDIEVGGNNYTFEYDVCGNQTKENQERKFQWDYADRMKLYYNQVNPGQEPSTYAHYLYDAGGNRVKKLTRVSGGNWECITYIDGLIEYREDDKGQQQSISHIMDDSKRIASVRNGFEFDDSTPAIKYNMDDHLGSSNLSVDENGTIVNREEYYPFGETSFGSYSKKRYRFCGKEKDEESGLYYYGARYYSPWTCRFVSVDPLAGKYPFYTAYQYAGNKPINSIDRDGLEETGNSPQQNSTSSSNSQPSTPANSTAPVVPINAINGLKKQFTEFTEQQKTEAAKPVNQKLAEAANSGLEKNNIKGDNTVHTKDKLVDNVKTSLVVPTSKQATLSAKDPYAHLNSFERGMIVNNPVTTPIAIGGGLAAASALAAPIVTGTGLERFASATADAASQVSYIKDINDYNISSTFGACLMPNSPFFASGFGNFGKITIGDIRSGDYFRSSLFGDQTIGSAATQTFIGGSFNYLGMKGGNSMKSNGFGTGFGNKFFAGFSTAFLGNQGSATTSFLLEKY